MSCLTWCIKKDETGSNIPDTIREVLNDWKIPKDQVVSVTTIGASNICKFF
jgi:hypothetical protein